MMMKAIVCLFVSVAASAGQFERRWVYTSETSAVICWQLDDIRSSALSTVEWGDGQRTDMTTSPRWNHFHRLAGLKPGAVISYRMVNVDPATKRETRSERLALTTRRMPDAIRVPDQVKGPPYTLDKPGATYILTRDISADGDAVIITAPDVTFDLDGHTITFGSSTSKQVFGVNAKSQGKVVICNGHIAQGARSGKYSACVESRWRPEPREIFGISTDVHLPCAYPVRGFGAAAHEHIHHNHLSSRVTELESRHYPGNDLLRLDIKGGHIHVHDNLLTGGCHRAIGLNGDGPNVKVHHNDIRHHQQYVNGYAFGASCPGLDIHHNKVTSLGRGVHLTAEGIRFHHNYMDTAGHQQLDDIPAKSRPFKVQIVEQHGVKFEGRKVKNCKVHDNFVRITQKLPEGKWKFVPATPLNIACYDPNAMNEIYGNTFVALTHYKTSRYGGYGNSGQWASGIYLVGMTHGPAAPGKYAAYVHDNTFITNHLFVGSQRPVNMTVRIEKNTFSLAKSPPPVNGRTPFRRIGEALEAAVKAGGNVIRE